MIFEEFIRNEKEYLLAFMMFFECMAGGDFGLMDIGWIY